MSGEKKLFSPFYIYIFLILFHSHFERCDFICNAKNVCSAFKIAKKFECNADVEKVSCRQICMFHTHTSTHSYIGDDGLMLKA